MKATVIARRLAAPHQSEPFTEYRPLSSAMVAEVRRAVADIFDALGGPALLGDGREVYIKPNAVDAKPYSHTRPEVLAEVMRYWQRAGARRIHLFENATQGNCTRLVFRATGYRALCREYGVRPVYLDEERGRILVFRGKASAADGVEDGYDCSSFFMPQTVMDIMRRREDYLYINVPKLKTHSMGVVTLGVKNQWGFPHHFSRGHDHNFNLHHKLVDILSYIKPDITLIEGVEGTIHGHYFATALADRQVRPFRLLMGSRNVVAADIAAASVFGLTVDEVPHLSLAVKRRLSEGVRGMKDIAVTGDRGSLEAAAKECGRPKKGGFPWDLYPSFPADVAVVTGKALACREGCRNNPLCVLQTMALDQGGRGGFTIVLGKGHDAAAIDAITGRVLIAGHCAIEETAPRLLKRLGKKNVYLSGQCNDLAATIEALCHLMKVAPTDLVPLPPLTAAAGFVTARLAGSRARVPHPLAHLIKRV